MPATKPKLEDGTVLTTKVTVPIQLTSAFADWQAELNAEIAAFPGFVSLEILSPESGSNYWLLFQRFSRPDQLTVWKASKNHISLLNKLKALLPPSSAIEEETSNTTKIQSGVTEVFVTQVEPDQEAAYRAWIAKIHQTEAKFPGFKSVYVQSPSEKGGRNWITFLQFDTQENLDRWLASAERQAVLAESKKLIMSLESHRVISSYAGWFSSVAKNGALPPLWKQTMIILLVLFPIVMLELRYLSPLTAHLNLSLATFIGNSISVMLLSWPLLPIAIYLLKWWLLPTKNKIAITVAGTLLVLALYLLEIFLFWK